LIAHRILGFAIGAVAGSVGWFALTPDATPGPVETPPKAVASGSTPVRASCPEEAQLRTQLDALDAHITGTAVGVAVAGAQQEEAIGARIEPPSPLPPEFEEAAIESALSEMVGEFGGIVAGLDCGEYPCTAVVVFDKEAMPGVSYNINDDPVVYATVVDGVTVGEYETVDEAQDAADQLSFRAAAEERWPNMRADSYGARQETTSAFRIAFLAEAVEPFSAERKHVDFLVNEAANTFAEEVQGARDQLVEEPEQGE
jgi:hypothetical protein